MAKAESERPPQQWIFTFHENLLSFFASFRFYTDLDYTFSVSCTIITFHTVGDDPNKMVENILHIKLCVWEKKIQTIKKRKLLKQAFIIASFL